ncbi:MAG: indole-3-glycerol phosphate synthase TrpC [Planctomycetes bacterium]|nr:indole-3-glycerol phosphate synthase TrpC [Planctomycetota bacterium]
MSHLPDILNQILKHKRQELAEAEARAPLGDLKSRAADRPAPADMAAALRRDGDGPVRLIAEIKRRSPSAGDIVAEFDPRQIAAQYAEAGADAVSVLTNERYFGGRLEYLEQAKSVVPMPVMRKDFLIAPYQVWEARAWAADTFLLIADALEGTLLAELIALGRELGMEPLVESHDEEALGRTLEAGAKLIGVNNRDLRTFTVDLATTERLARLVPAGCVLVAESGIATDADVSRLLAAGVQAILVGESLMRSGDKSELVAKFKAAR